MSDILKRVDKLKEMQGWLEKTFDERAKTDLAEAATIAAAYAQVSTGLSELEQLPTYRQARGKAMAEKKRHEAPAAASAIAPSQEDGPRQTGMFSKGAPRPRV